MVNHCFSAVFMIYHIHNLPTEDFRKSVCPTSGCFSVQEKRGL